MNASVESFGSDLVFDKETDSVNSATHSFADSLKQMGIDELSKKEVKRIKKEMKPEGIWFAVSEDSLLIKYHGSAFGFSLGFAFIGAVGLIILSLMYLFDVFFDGAELIITYFGALLIVGLLMFSFALFLFERRVSIWQRAVLCDEVFYLPEGGYWTDLPFDVAKKASLILDRFPTAQIFVEYYKEDPFLIAVDPKTKTEHYVAHWI